MREVRHKCWRRDCTQRFIAELEDDYGDDWAQEFIDTMHAATTEGWQIVSLPGKIAYLCPEHHDKNAPRR